MIRQIQCFVLATTIAACSQNGVTPSPTDPSCEEFIVGSTACNGSPELCDRRYNDIAYATTHNAMANEDEDWFAPNQKHGIQKQLLDGVRALMIDTYYNDENAEHIPSLCHGHCLYGAIPMHDAFVKLEGFLRCNPNQILTLIVEAYVSSEDTALAFEETGLNRYAYAHERGKPWPTLDELIQVDKRLIVLSSNGGRPDWYMDIWAHAFDTPFSAASPEDLVCEIDRGSLDNSLFILNHFLSTPLPSEALAEQVNHNPFFSDRAQRCRETFQRLPNFPTVDFYHIGNILDVIATLNQR